MLFQDVIPKVFLQSPILVGIAVLSVYALGNLVEMFGEIFLVRAAAGMFWSMSFPNRNTTGSRRKIINKITFALKICAVPFLIIYNVAKGFLGYTSYQIEISSSLTQKAKKYYDNKIKPEHRVEDGIKCPVGNSAETTWKHFVDLFDTDTDKRWARRSIARVKDVLAITTAMIIVFVSLSVVILVKPIPSYPNPSTHEYNRMIESIAPITKHQEKDINTPPQERLKHLKPDYVKIKIEHEHQIRNDIDSKIKNIPQQDLKKWFSETRSVLNDFISIISNRMNKYVKEKEEAERQKDEKRSNPSGKKPRTEIDGLMDSYISQYRIYQEAEKQVTVLYNKHKSSALHYKSKVVWIRVFWVFLIGLLFMYTYQAYFVTQRNVIECLIETLAIKEAKGNV